MVADFFREIYKLSLTLNLKCNMFQTPETRKIVSVTHELITNGHILRETRLNLKIENVEIGEDKFIVEHLREIDDRYYKVILTETHATDKMRCVETNLDPEQVEIFLEMWEELWSPRQARFDTFSLNI